MKKKAFYILMICVLFLTQKSFAQKDSYIKPGLLSAAATFAPAWMLNRNEMNYYLIGYLEYRLDNHLSFRGDLDYMLTNDSGKFLVENNRISAGFQYCQSYGNFEINTGIMPGIALVQSRFGESDLEVTPIYHINAGIRFYVWKYFHFFANLNYFHERLNTLYDVNGKADELMLSAGLGWNVPLIGKKNR